MNTMRAITLPSFSVSRVVRLVFISCILAVAVFGHNFPLVRYLDGQLTAYRFAAAPRTASGNIVYLAIDKKTLDTVGQWPWPRSVYATVLKKLGEAGVNDIFFDIDFSTPSNQKDDAQFSSALSEAGGGVILPVFRQYASVDDKTMATVTRPIASFADNSWLAFANVSLEEDGSIRRFQLGDFLDGHLTQSVAAVLSKSQPSLGSPMIDYSIQPSSVPTISLSNLLDPAFDFGELKGRSVVVGAYATELKDIFPVPVYGQLSGPMLHVLAAETLFQGRVLAEFNQLPIELALAALVIACALGLRKSSTIIVGSVGLLALACGEAASYLLQKESGVVVQTAVGWAIMILGMALLLTEKLDLTRFIAEIANAEQRNIRRLLRKIVADSTDGVLAFDHRLIIFEESDSARAMLNLDGGSKGSNLRDAVPASLYDLVQRLVADHARDPQKVHGDTGRMSLESSGSMRHLDAVVTISPAERPLELGDDLQTRFIGSIVVRDITARYLYEERLRYLADFDDLTGLMNRRSFSDYMSTITEPYYLVAVGVHRLSVINATMGRDVGDELLKQTGIRLTTDHRVIAGGRLVGDVFAAVVPKRYAVDIKSCAEAVIRLFDSPVELRGGFINVSVRVGIIENTDQTVSGSGIVECAEHALDQAKIVAGGGWCAYDPKTAELQRKSRQLENAMRDSLTKGEFFLQYQPQVDLASGKLVGAEALLRWKHPDFGLVSPATFIPVAEANGFVCDLGRWALTEACREAATWPAELSVAVNVAPIQLIRTNLIADVRDALASSRLDAARLHLEITESAFVENSQPIMEALEELRTMGITIALDDFGTGYSSLSYLAGFPLDKLKIDQSFVQKMAADPQSLSIVHTVKALATGLGLAVVAEGVETEVESDLLRQIGCEVGQGYLYGKPQSARDLLSLLDRAPWDTAS